jgi:iron complex outermembrane receptor protein
VFAGGVLAILVTFFQNHGHCSSSGRGTRPTLPSPDVGLAGPSDAPVPPPVVPVRRGTRLSQPPTNGLNLLPDSFSARNVDSNARRRPERPSSRLRPPSQLKAVVVTAQRREESAQKVPTAVSVLSGENLEDSGIGRKAGDVLDYVPNASAATQLHARPRWWIRGVGTGQQQLDFANPVGFYLDDVYISNASATGFPALRS